MSIFGLYNAPQAGPMSPLSGGSGWENTLKSALPSLISAGGDFLGSMISGNAADKAQGQLNQNANLIYNRGRFKPFNIVSGLGNVNFNNGTVNLQQSAPYSAISSGLLNAAGNSLGAFTGSSNLQNNLNTNTYNIANQAGQNYSGFNPTGAYNSLAPNNLIGSNQSAYNYNPFDPFAATQFLTNKMNAINVPFNQLATNNLTSKLFNQGTLGATAGYNQLRALDTSQALQALQNSYNAFGTANTVQNQLFNQRLGVHAADLSTFGAVNSVQGQLGQQALQASQLASNEHGQLLSQGLSGATGALNQQLPLFNLLSSGGTLGAQQSSANMGALQPFYAAGRNQAAQTGARGGALGSSIGGLSGGGSGASIGGTIGGDVGTLGGALLGNMLLPGIGGPIGGALGGAVGGFLGNDVPKAADWLGSTASSFGNDIGSAASSVGNFFGGLF